MICEVLLVRLVWPACGRGASSQPGGRHGAPGPPLGYLKFVQRRLYKPGKLAICNFLWSICMEKIPPGVPVKCGVFSGVWRGRHETCSTNWSSQMAQTVSYLDYFDHQRPESQEWWRQVGVRGVGGWWVS